jgi:molybdopterin-synthase adenylyltransferase
VREFIPVPDARADPSFEAERSVSLEALLDVLNRAKREGLTLIECHTHPITRCAVRFSPIDDAGMEETAAYVLDALGRPYGALVFGQASVDGRYWRLGQRPRPVERIVVGGPTQEVLFPTSSLRAEGTLDRERYDRHIAVVGEAGQARLGSITVAIVGLSGLGSHVAQQLVYLGVRRFILIDSDVVAKSNLNRVVGALPGDVGRTKVEVVTRWLRAVAPRADVTALPHDLRSTESFRALAGVDVAFGCVDNDGARLVLNELARAYNFPLFDLASGITAADGSFEEAGGRIALVHPGGPCLFCLGEIDRCEAAFFLAPEEKRAEDRRLGYVDGWEAHAPSVVSLNGVVASMAVSEFFLSATGLAPAAMLTYYYLRENGSGAQRIARRVAERSAKCFTCSREGLGELAETRRFGGGGEAG